MNVMQQRDGNIDSWVLFKLIKFNYVLLYFLKFP
jgi:hypothetical protein